MDEDNNEILTRINQRERENDQLALRLDDFNRTIAEARLKIEEVEEEIRHNGELNRLDEARMKININDDMAEAQNSNMPLEIRRIENISDLNGPQVDRS